MPIYLVVAVAIGVHGSKVFDCIQLRTFEHDFAVLLVVSVKMPNNKIQLLNVSFVWMERNVDGQTTHFFLI